MGDYPFVIKHRGKSHRIYGNLALISARSDVVYPSKSHYLTLTFSDDTELSGLIWVWDFLHGAPYRKPTGPYQQRVSILQICRILQINTVDIILDLRRDIFTGLPRPDPNAFDFYDIRYLNWYNRYRRNVDDEYLSLFPIEKRITIVPPSLLYRDKIPEPFPVETYHRGMDVDKKLYVVHYDLPINVGDMDTSRRSNFNIYHTTVKGLRDDRSFGIVLPPEWRDDMALRIVTIGSPPFVWYQGQYYHKVNGRLVVAPVQIYQNVSNEASNEIRVLPDTNKLVVVRSQLLAGKIGTPFHIGGYILHGFYPTMFLRSRLVREVPIDSKYYQGVPIHSYKALERAWCIINYVSISGFKTGDIPPLPTNDPPSLTTEEAKEVWQILNYFNVSMDVKDIEYFQNELSYLGEFCSTSYIVLSEQIENARKISHEE